MRSADIVLQGLDEVHSILAGQDDIADDEVGHDLIGHVQSHDAILGFMTFIGTGESRLQEMTHVGVVLNDQDGKGFRQRNGLFRIDGAGLRVCGIQGYLFEDGGGEFRLFHQRLFFEVLLSEEKADLEGGALPFFAFDVDGTMMQGHQFFGKGQPQP